jgi:hypothetical protein
MTLVAVWTVQGRMYAIADTRLSRERGNVLTEHGPKLLPLTVVCRQPGESGEFDKIVFKMDFGFAYSGSTLSALASQVLANTLFANLAGNLGALPPTLAEISHAVGAISFEYMRDVGQLAGMSGQFKAIVFGFCVRSAKYRAFIILPRIDGGQFLVDVIEHDQSEAAIIGSCPDLLRARIRADNEERVARGDTHPVLDIDAPRRALQALIDENADETIGGSVQQAWATPAGFLVVGNMRPIVPRPPSTRNAGLFVLGFDTFDIRNIGDHQVIMRAGR